MYPTALDIGAELRDARHDAGLSLAAMAAHTAYSKPYLSNIERGSRAATPDIVAAYERVIGPSGDSDVFRKDITHPGLTKIKGASKLAELSGAIEAGKPGIVAKAPTAHSTDLAVASRATPDGITELRRWMTEGETATLRTNALSMLSKMPGRENAQRVIEVLEEDTTVRRLCVTSEVSRLLQVDWEAAKRAARDLTTVPEPRKLARKLAKEVTDPNDTESRWCGSYMLRELAPVLGR